MKRQLTNAYLVALTVGSAACSSSTPPTRAAAGDDAGMSPPEDARSNAPTRDGDLLTEADSAVGQPYRLTMEVPDVQPGVEGTKCMKIRLDNPAAINVGRIHNTLSDGSHHLVVSAVEDPAETEEPLFDCPPFRAVLIGAPLTVTQKHDDLILMPEGVGFPLVAEQLMHIEMHYINTGSEPADVRADIELFPVQGDGPVQEASFLIVGDLGISIPPRTEHQMEAKYVALPDTLEGVHFYAATGHTHRFGTGTRLGVSSGPSDPGETVYEPEPFDWAEPELKFYSPTFQVPPGGGFNFDCTWNNPTDQTLGFGESALDEMCFFWAYFYPRGEGDRTLLTGVPGATD